MTKIQQKKVVFLVFLPDFVFSISCFLENEAKYNQAMTCPEVLAGYFYYGFLTNLFKGKKNEIQCPNKECDYKEE